ncbi:glycosyltransferase family 2 protein [Vibrio sp. qd031]|uniref:glycosyltransferase family 2 protein n=1 Tax=Vibrio sp. qd031 TaxID=1603038 RepID=UPI00117FCD1D|nr:glycosyltransferase family 2 protein [Vibrio sp. qd031]
MATYNGELFLEQQIQTIQCNHGYKDCVQRLIVVDDGSTDQTLSILRRLATVDDKIEVHHNGSGINGPMHNFAYGLSLSSAEWVALCDQDDVWFSHKLETLLKVAELESDSSLAVPIAIFSDKQIVDDELNVICESYYKLKQIPKQWHINVTNLAMQNVASGCTMLVNRSLLNIALPIPINAYMHDWWLALLAKQFGKLVLVDEALIQYRQHSANTIGATRVRLLSHFLSFKHYYQQFEKSFLATSAQAKELVKLAKNTKTSCHQNIKWLAKYPTLSLKVRVALVHKGIITRSSVKAKLALYIMALKGFKRTK